MNAVEFVALLSARNLQPVATSSGLMRCLLLDVLSAVTAANFANSLPSGGEAFCMNSLVGLSGLGLKANKLYWPVNGRRATTTRPAPLDVAPVILRHFLRHFSRSRSPMARREGGILKNRLPQMARPEARRRWARRPDGGEPRRPRRAYRKPRPRHGRPRPRRGKAHFKTGGELAERGFFALLDRSSFQAADCLFSTTYKMARPAGLEPATF